MKIVHIHTDYKFVAASRKFLCDYFENVIVVFQGNQPFKGIYKEYKQFIVTKHNNSRDIETVVNLCNSSDLIVVYGLDFVVQEIVLKVNGNKKIAWRFFGYELYNWIPHLCYTRRTLQEIELSFFSRMLMHLKQMKLIFKLFDYVGSIIKFHKRKQIRVIKRIDLFIGLCDIEYIFLLRYFPYLPPFVGKSFSKKHMDNCYEKHSPFKIIIGNNRFAFNNHFEIIDIIYTKRDSERFQFIFPFNYGAITKYSLQVEHTMKDFSNVHLIKTFVPKENYEKIFFDISAFVHNSIRQMAVGNIFMALANGVKIYLNKKNIVYNWLLKEGFYIYTVENFKNDIIAENLQLTTFEIKHNIDTLNCLSEKYSVTSFQETIYSFLS